MSKNVLDAKDPIGAVAQERAKQAREEAVVGATVNKFGREVIVTRKKYAHMRKCGDLLIDIDGNQANFKKLSDKDISDLKDGKRPQNKQVATKTPEDITEIQGNSKTSEKQAELDAKEAELKAREDAVKKAEKEAKDKEEASKKANTEAPKTSAPAQNQAPTNPQAPNANK